ncbi:hypothetical protein FZEAL_1292 [Fusarium zealandicum]|uniref:Zinc finger PHD-type domain-containing protein n=1 Tax=Fusarium zealandicum TaxID=1053134 RepID=A0A8H4UT09_9HYPO|nr:hypothetical protein FZEAL_1292 [Fusarium zealandicum]
MSWMGQDLPMSIDDRQPDDSEIQGRDAPVANTATSNPSSMEQLAYTHQFSSETSVILNRINASSRKGNGEQIGTTAVQELDATVPIREPASSTLQQTLQLAPGHGPASWGSVHAGTKRKRDSSSEKADFTQDTIAFPWSDQAASLHQPGLGTQPQGQQVQCSKCEGSAHMSQNGLVTCTRCLSSWHQQCHSPTITGEATSASSFTCAACTADREESARLKGKSSQQRQYEIEKLRQKRLAALPRGVVPAKPALVGFGAGQAPDASVSPTLCQGCCQGYNKVLLTRPKKRAEYFESMRKTDLLNVLSLCDQLKPNLLVDVLVSVSKRHPDLPLFSSPDWETQTPATARTHNISNKPRHGHVLLSAKARPKHKTTKKILKRTRVIEVITSAPEEDEDVLPPTWAKADEGLYSKLPPEVEDREFLLDENDEESFSHFLVDGFGKQIMEPVGA